VSRSVPPAIITTPAALQALAGRLAGETVIACDLEADSLHRYQEKVCLLQLATPREAVLVDPLALPDLSPLAPLFADPAARKIFHGADYDIRSLHRDFGIEVHNLFDTMVACQFLGERELGLAAVLKKRFGVELDKSLQRADWSRRPLTSAMVDYAAQDTALLIDLYGELGIELRQKGRLAWVEEECALLSRVRATTRNGEPLFLRFKGASRLEPLALAVLEEVLRYRDRLAKSRDVPPFKVLGTETVRELAERKPTGTGELTGITGLSPKLLERYGKGILEAVAKGREVPPEQLPRFPATVRVKRSGPEEVRLQRLKGWRERRAKELGIEPGILANNALLEELATQFPQDQAGLAAVAGLKCWQKEEFGREILALLGRG